MASDLSQFLRDEPQITSLFMKSTKIGGIPIINENDNLVLGDSGQYSTVNAFNMNLGGQLVADVAIISGGINTSNVEPNTGSGGVVNIDGYVSVNNYGINNVNTLTLKDANLGSAGQVLGLDNNQNLTWLTNGGGSVGTLNGVLSNGNDAGQLSMSNINDVQATSYRNMDNSFTVNNKGNVATTQLSLNNGGLIVDSTASYGVSGQLLSSLGSSGVQWIDQGISTVPTLQEVLTQSNDAGQISITNVNNVQATSFNNIDSSFTVDNKGNVEAPNLTVITEIDTNIISANQLNLKNSGVIIDAVASYGTSGQILSSLSTGGTQWIDQPTTTIPTLDEVLTASNDANNKSIVNLSAINTTGDNFVVSSTGAIIANSYNNQDNSFYATDNGTVKATGMQANDLTCPQIQQASQNPTFYLNPQGVIYGQTLITETKLNNIYYVSSTGLNFQNNGSITSPYKTIQFAIGIVEALTAVDGQFRYIFLAGGTYAENLTITQPLAIIGLSQGSNSAIEGCYIQGNITLNMNNTTVSMNQNNIIVSSVLIDGSIINTTSTANSRLIMSNCYVYSNTCINYYPSFCTDGRIFLDNCIFTSTNSAGTTPLINIGLGMLKMSLCEFTQQSNYPCLQFTNAGRVDKVALCTFENTTSSTSAQPLVYINTSGTNTFSFGQCAFSYTSSANKSGSAISSGICINSVSANPTILIVNNFFSLLGTTTANYAVQDSQFGTGNAGIIVFGNNTATPTNGFAIHAILNTNKFATTPVV